MIYSDVWSVRIKSEGKYEIVTTSDIEILLSNSLNEFLERFLLGNVFDKNGLYNWQPGRKLFF